MIPIAPRRTHSAYSALQPNRGVTKLYPPRIYTLTTNQRFRNVPFGMLSPKMKTSVRCFVFATNKRNRTFNRGVVSGKRQPSSHREREREVEIGCRNWGSRKKIAEFVCLSNNEIRFPRALFIIGLPNLYQFAFGRKLKFVRRWMDRRPRWMAGWMKVLRCCRCRWNIRKQTSHS